MTKHELALKLGFGEDEKAYLVYGDDTYSIKDTLKKMGARFDPTLKWYFSKKVELPEGYQLCEFSFDELYTDNGRICEFKEDAKNTVRRRLAELKGPSSSVYYPAEIKTRISNITAKLSAVRGFEGTYGYSNVYTFTSGDYIFVWITTKILTGINVGDTVDITGTIKNFNEYLGERQTVLSRCLVTLIK